MSTDHLGPLGRPTCVQFATNGDWENAAVIDAVTPEVSPVRRRTLARGGELALELVFADAEHHPSFVGIRWQQLDGDQATSVLTNAEAAFARLPRDCDASQAMDIFLHHLNLQLSFARPTHMELGVFNRWRSIGSHTVWRNGEPAPTPADTADELRRHAPHLLADQSNPLIAEVAYRDPIRYWIGYPVSEDTAHGHRADLDRVTTVCARAATPSPAIDPGHRPRR